MIYVRFNSPNISLRDNSTATIGKVLATVAIALTKTYLQRQLVDAEEDIENLV